ncbi:MAG: S8 family serine peptidase [Bryobacteraceae bacterium]
MPRFWALFLSVPLFAATVPNRYIVQFSIDPVAVRASRNTQRGSIRVRLHSADLEQHRAAIHAQQAAARAAIERSGGVIRGSLETLSNALLVEIPDEMAGELARAPGVQSVYPVRRFKMSLDHALPLHHVPEVWTQIGLANAGAGVMIGMIDSGIEIGHPGFNDAGFTAPPGFPVAGAMSDFAFTNNKVIVARSYASLFAEKDPDPSVRDHVGHGTATAMTAAGVANTGALATISGVAPQAYLGIYKVFGTPGINDDASEDAILAAIDDAVNDGMSVINLSLGYDVPSIPTLDPLVKAVEAASQFGVIVVAAAGNNGPNPGTVGSPAIAPHAIAAAASNNSRMFAGFLQVPGGGAITALPSAGVNPFSPIAGPLVDVATLDPTGLACNLLPANSLNNTIALIERGTCNFEVKFDYAQAAGAVAAIIYDNVPNEALVLMGVGHAMLPAAMISNSDGLTLKQIRSSPTVTIQFYQPTYVNPESLATFSAAGPSLDNSIKPDLTAVGENFYTAAETIDSSGVLYNPTGYTVTQGTSFSAPLVSGAAALLESGRPGLSADQYRSLLIDTADAAYATPGSAALVQQSGGGFMNALSALNATAAASPVSLSFGAGASANFSGALTISNVGAVADTFQISAAPRDAGAPVPQFSTTQTRLEPGASVSIPVVFTANGVAPGQYEGFIQIQGASATVPTRVPYWFAVPSGTPTFVTLLELSASGTAGSTLTDAAVFRITDAAGLPVSTAPSVTTVSGGGRVNGITGLGSAYPNDYAVSVRLGAQPGSNVFQIQAGSVSTQITITGQ